MALLTIVYKNKMRKLILLNSFFLEVRYLHKFCPDFMSKTFNSLPFLAGFFSPVSVCSLLAEM